MKDAFSKSITDQVYEILHRAFEAGRFAPGARVYEERLASELGISKTPLRLALHQLKRDGVVRIEPRKGIYLATPSLTEIIELIELREVLEGLAARRAASQQDRGFVNQMEACFAPFSETALARQRLRYAAADHRFHTILVEASGSGELRKTLEVVNIRLHQHRLENQTTGHDLRPIHRQHLALIRWLRVGDAERAEALARDHVRHQMALKMLKETAIAPTEPSASAAKRATADKAQPTRRAVTTRRRSGQ